MKTLLILNGKRVLADVRRSWPIIVLLSLVFIGLNQILVSEPRLVVQKTEDTQPVREQCAPPPLKYSLVMSTEELETVMLERTWPILRGYEGRDANAISHPEDTMLFQRLTMSQRMMKNPLLRVKNTDGTTNARHDWRFEKIIHQTWKTEQIPGPTVPWVRKWLEQNPDWTYIFWTDESSREFVSEHFPALLPVYDSWTIPVQKADMFRLIALFAFGGVYADLDMEPLRPLSEIRSWSSCVISREPDLMTYVMVDDLNFWSNNWTFTCNAFMACQSHHPFLHYMIGRITRMSPKITGRSCSLAETILCTGPMFVSLSYGFYRRSIPQQVRDMGPDLDVICPDDANWFLPTFDNTRLLHAQRTCKQKVLSAKAFEACSIWKLRNYTNTPLNYSFTNHHWFHSYHFKISRNRVDIKTVTKPVIWTREEQDIYFQVDFV